jgi:hypothetical protein
MEKKLREAPYQQHPAPVTVLTDAEALDQVQKDALKYFWEYAETN